MGDWEECGQEEYGHDLSGISALYNVVACKENQIDSGISTWLCIALCRLVLN